MQNSDRANIVAIASSSTDLDRCKGTLSKFAEEYQIHILMVKSRISKKAHVGDTYKIHEIHEFDYSTVTQNNVNALRAIIDDLGPLLAIIPSTRTPDPRLGILARSALLACRSIANILMYDRSKPHSASNTILSLLKADKSRRVEAFESQRVVLLGDIFK